MRVTILQQSTKPARWPRLIASGLAAGLLINSCEWAVHHGWLEEAWAEAFAALGKTPKGWAIFIPANFWLGIFAVWAYRWLAGLYGPGWGTALRTSTAVWLIFWVIPTAAMQPLELFPNRLLAWTIAIGVLDGYTSTLLGAWLYDAPRWGSRRTSASS
jgi:hypothetical protein